MRKKIYQAAILYHGGVDGLPELVKDVHTVLAYTEEDVKVLLHRALPEAYLSELEDVEFIVSQFNQTVYVYSGYNSTSYTPSLTLTNTGPFHTSITS